MAESKLVLCKASAGSGKTYMLTRTYLQIVLKPDPGQPCNYDRILAVTFTNKATDEMKSRILSALTAISQMEKEEDIVKTEFAKDLLEGNPSWDFTQLVEKAKSALGQILHDYSQFSIMTIDKFFNRIVKSFLFELKLQNTSKVSMDTQQALDESIAEMLSEYNQDMNDVLSRWLKDIAAQNLNEGKNWQPENIIKRISGELLKERSTQWNLNYPIEKVEKLYQQFVEIENSFDSAIKDYAKDIIAAVRKSGLEEGYFSRNSFPNQTKRFLDDPSKEHYTETVKRAIDGANSPFTKAAFKKDKGGSIESIWLNEIQPLAHQLLTYYQENIEEKNAVTGFKKYLKPLALLAFVADKMKEYREKNGIMLISDNNTLIEKVVENSDVPFLYERIGNKYRYILLDEFQDTSSLQWKNFLPLIVEVLAHAEDCKVLIVGDAKQAIYRWRGGDAQLIQKGVMHDLSRYWEAMGSVDLLENNYRSYKDIVEFNNDFFEELAQSVDQLIQERYLISEEVTANYDAILNLYNEEAKQKHVSENKGYVEVKFFEKPDKNDEEAISVEEATFNYLKETIARLINDKGYNQSDIAVLVRKNSEAVAISDLLKSEKYDVVTSDALLFNAHPIIQLLLSTLELMLDPEEDLLQSKLLFQYNKVHQISSIEDGLLEKENRKQYFEKHLKALTVGEVEKQLKALTIYEIVRSLFEILHLRDFRDVYTEQFLDAVMEYQSGAYQSSIIDFLEWWGRNQNRSVSISLDLNAIRIDTIHKSKGLSYKVVLIPFFDWEFVASSYFLQPILWPEIRDSMEAEGFQYLPIDFNQAKETIYKKDYQDEVILQAIDNLNVAYVALTRAVDKMYIVCPIKFGKDDEVDNKRIGGLAYQILSEKINGFNQEELVYHQGEELPKKIKAQSSIGSNQFSLHEVKEVSHDSNQLADTTLPIDKNIQLSPLRSQNIEAIIGDLIHDILSEYRPDKDLESIFSKYQYEYTIKDELKQEVFQRVRNFFLHPEIHKIYQSGGKVLTERALFYKEELFRFDLLVLNGQKGELYDFKTGLEKSNKKLNTEKLIQYKSALENMGYTISKAAFIFIDPSGEPKIEQVA